MMNIRRKYTLFRTNNQVNLTLFRTNNQANSTLFPTNNQANLTLFLTNATKSEARPLPLSSREGSDMQCIYIVAEVSGLRSNQRPLP
mgnify:CR=1 FL=1